MVKVPMLRLEAWSRSKNQSYNWFRNRILITRVFAIILVTVSELSLSANGLRN